MSAVALGGARVGAPGDTTTSAVVLLPTTAAQARALVRRPGAAATLVNIWATWCGPCREEFPQLLAVARRHPNVRLVLISTDFDDQRAEARRFLAVRGVRDTTFLKADADQVFIDGFDTRWTGSLPATFLYDRAGRAVAFWEGAADSARFESAITKALGALR